MGTALIVIGVVVLIGAVLYYVGSHPKKAQSTMQDAQDVVNTMRRGADVVRDVRPTTNASVEEQLLDMRLGEFVEIQQGSTSLPEQHRLTGRGRHEATNKQYVPKGEEYPVLLFDGAQLLQFERRWYWFGAGEPLSDSDFKTLEKIGVVFSREHNQQPGSYTDKWRDHSVTPMEIGFSIFHLESGQAYLADGAQNRWMLAKLEDSSWIMVDFPVVGERRVWTVGQEVSDLDSFVRNVLRASA